MILCDMCRVILRDREYIYTAKKKRVGEYTMTATLILLCSLLSPVEMLLDRYMDESNINDRCENGDE